MRVQGDGLSGEYPGFKVLGPAGALGRNVELAEVPSLRDLLGHYFPQKHPVTEHVRLHRDSS